MTPTEMKKVLKTIGYTLGGLVILLIIACLLIRFAFKEQVIAYINKQQKKEYIELLRNATPYTTHTTQYHFVYRQDTLRAKQIRDFFRLDTLLTDSAATTWEKTLTLGFQLPSSLHPAT